MFKDNNRNTTTRCKICSKLTIKTPKRRRAFIVNFKHIFHLVLVFLMLTFSRQMPAGNGLFRIFFAGLTHKFPMHPFSTHWKLQKSIRFSEVFKGLRKSALATNDLMSATSFYSSNPSEIFEDKYIQNKFCFTRSLTRMKNIRFCQFHTYKWISSSFSMYYMLT